MGQARRHSAGEIGWQPDLDAQARRPSSTLARATHVWERWRVSTTPSSGNRSNASPTRVRDRLSLWSKSWPHSRTPGARGPRR